MEDIPMIIFFCLILGIIFGWIAAKKNRRFYIWGPILSITAFLFLVFGVLIPSKSTGLASSFSFILGYGSLLLCLAAIVAIMALPYLCPKCKGKLTRQQWKEGNCSNCGKISEADEVKAVKKKVNTHSWVFIIVPPLFLCPLVLVPLDIGTMLFWGPAFIILLVSMWHVVTFIVNRIFKKTPLQRAFIRPSLSVVIIIGALVLVYASQGTADKFARRVANAVNIKCKKEGRCPESIDGFECASNRGCSVRYGDYGAKFRVRYEVSNDRMFFRVIVRHNIDKALIFDGGVTNEIREKLDM